MVLILQPVPKSEAFFQHNADRVERFRNEIFAGATGVVLIGDSRLRYAVENDEALAWQLSESGNRPFSVLRLTNNWAVFDDFSPLIPRVLDASPSLVLIQEELLAKERARSALLLEGRSYLIWKLFGIGPWNLGSLDQHALQTEMRCEALYLEETVEARRKRVFRWISFDPEGQNAKFVADFLQRLEKQGTAVRHMRIPITSSGQEGLPGFSRPDSPDTLTFSQHFDDHHYCDIVHMNDKGRSAYSSWLVNKIVNIL